VASINIIKALRRSVERPKQAPPDHQQAAYQPSGNGINGQANPLSFAAFGGGLWLSCSAKKSCCGVGATAILTTSSNRSNSPSLIALSHVRERTVSKVFCFRIE
jgi:hypothetical protein